MPRKLVDLICAVPNADPSAVIEATGLLKKNGFETIFAPKFGPNSGSAALQKCDIEVTVNWSREEGLMISCRNRAFELERDALAELLRRVKTQHDDLKCLRYLQNQIARQRKDSPYRQSCLKQVRRDIRDAEKAHRLALFQRKLAADFSPPTTPSSAKRTPPRK